MKSGINRSQHIQRFQDDRETKSIHKMQTRWAPKPVTLPNHPFSLFKAVKEPHLPIFAGHFIGTSFHLLGTHLIVFIFAPLHFFHSDTPKGKVSCASSYDMMPSASLPSATGVVHRHPRLLWDSPPACIEWVATLLGDVSVYINQVGIAKNYQYVLLWHVKICNIKDINMYLYIYI